MWFLSALWLLPLVTVQAQEDPHFVAEVLFCQPQDPVVGLVKMFDDSQMFSYNFTNGSSIPRIQEFEKWADHSFPNRANISNDLNLCKGFLGELTEVLTNVTPEAKGTTKVKLMTAQPVRLGEPNTLICFVGNIYPPILTITWQKNGLNVTEGITHSGYFAMTDMTFQTFSYLKISPQLHETFACIVHSDGDDTPAVGFWGFYQEGYIEISLVFKYVLGSRTLKCYSCYRNTK
uniref:Major histocompatibility complex, class II, DM alpha n=1 Tax=Leptobrachium leishanense TaxID=445787 RepID=A0A8C5Q858_9ANUR